MGSAMTSRWTTIRIVVGWVTVVVGACGCEYFEELDRGLVDGGADSGCPICSHVDEEADGSESDATLDAASIDADVSDSNVDASPADATLDAASVDAASSNVGTSPADAILGVEDKE